MSESRTKPTSVSVDDFLQSASEDRRKEAHVLIDIMQAISGDKPVMWGSSIIGFGSQHYKYDTGREGDMPRLGFSPRKAKLTIYFEGFDDYGDELAKLGKHTTSTACLYMSKLSDIDLGVLTSMLERSFQKSLNESAMSTVDQYIASLPRASRPKFDELREIVKSTLPHANEVFSYGIVGYKTDEKRAKVYISGWKDHVAMYPIPNDEDLRKRLAPYIKGKGTLWFVLDKPLPAEEIKESIYKLAS